MKRLIRVPTFMLIALLMAGCADLPQGSVVQDSFLESARVSAHPYEIVFLSPENIPHFSEAYHWPRTTSGGAGATLMPGDTLTISIWDNQDNSLLVNAGQISTTIQNISIDDAGQIFLPYIGAIKVAGLSPSEARMRIQSEIAPVSPNVQVVLAVDKNPTVKALGGLASPGAYTIKEQRYRILDLIADAGGIPTSLRNPRVKLLRGTQTFMISAGSLYNTDARNITLRPGDAVVVTEDPRAFTAIGASGLEDLIPFPKDSLSALEALALANGLNDSSADPDGILILRHQYSHKPVIYVLNLTSADGLFAAKKFLIEDEDTLLPTQSPVVNTRTVLQIIGQTLGTTAALTNATN